jgi:hypothetical protein
MTVKICSDDLAFDKIHCHLLWIIGKINIVGNVFLFSLWPGVAGWTHVEKPKPFSLIPLLFSHRLVTL